MKKLTSLLLLLSMIAGTVLFAIPVGAQEAYYPELEGITMYAMGDSYFGGSSLGKDITWVNKLGNKYKMNYENYGIGGYETSPSRGLADRTVGVTLIEVAKELLAK